MKNFRTGNSCIPLAAASENIDQKHHLCGANQQVSAITIDRIMLILLIMKAHSITNKNPTQIRHFHFSCCRKDNEFSL